MLFDNSITYYKGGEATMKIAIISDIHGNLEALEKVAEDIKNLGITLVICLGDIVGYGPYPAECLTRVQGLATVILRGNHEQAVTDTIEEAREAMKDLAFHAIEFTRTKLSTSEIAYLNSLSPSQVLSEINLTIAHGSAVPDRGWTYVEKEGLIKQELKNSATRICVLGHTHVPLVYGSAHGLYKYLPDPLILGGDEKFIINVGSVGQPRDGDCRASYGVLKIENDATSFSLRRVFYNIQKTEDAMRAVMLDPILYERLYCGE
ncbi:MAG: metallophosphoesterase family protein [Patescibacteria group bacterium]